MKKKLLGLFVLLFPVFSRTQSLFFEKYPEAPEIVKGVYENMDELKKLPGDKGKIVFSIVSPEVAMYSGFIDELETVSAEVFYTGFGKEYGNFSLGQFQMKPSFAEDIERCYPQECQACTYTETIAYEIMDESDIRSERVDRLKKDSWQQVYLLCFYEIMEARHGGKVMTTAERVRFYASAYNYGFNAPVERIKSWMDEISFPGNLQKPLVSYADLARDFLLILRPDLENETIREASVQANPAERNKAAEAERTIFAGSPINLGKENRRSRVLPGLITTVLILSAIWFQFRRRRRKGLKRALSNSTATYPEKQVDPYVANR